MPDEVVYAPECAKFNQRQTFPLSTQQLAVQSRALKLYQYSTVTVLASRVYLDVLRGVFPQAYVKSPFTGSAGIGTMMGALTAAIKTNTPLA